jgi:hypothetical protein
LAGGALAGEPPGAFFKNSTWGYRVKTPKGWRQAALATDEMWVASKHLGKRELEAVKTEFWSREEPEMWVIGFPHTRKADAVKIQYRDYEDFVRRQEDFLDWSEGGYDLSGKKDIKIDGVTVTTYDIKAKEGARDRAPRRVVAWVYHFDDADFAVQFKILDEHYDRYAATFRACLKSFRRIKRTRAIPGTGTGEPAAPDAKELERLSPEDRERALKDATERRFRKEIDALQEGWKHQRSKHFLVLTNADPKFVRSTVAHAEAVRVHLEKFLGEKKAGYVPPGILRIFATDGERDAYQEAGGGKGGLVSEVLVVFGHGYVKDNEFEGVNRALLSQWLGARHELLEDSLPDWVSVALKKYMDMVRTKGKRITFTNEDWDRDSMRLAIKKELYLPAEELVMRGLKGHSESRPIDSGDRDLQRRSFGFWLLTKGNRGKHKNLIRDYLAALLQAIEAVEAGYLAEALAKSEKDGKPDPDAPSEREWARGEAKLKLGEIRQTAFDRIFGKWGAKDWQRLTKAWLSEAK